MRMFLFATDVAYQRFPPPSHALTQVHPLELARQITIHEWDLYSRIEFWEVNGKEKVDAPRLQRSIQFSNKVTSAPLRSRFLGGMHLDTVSMDGSNTTLIFAVASRAGWWKVESGFSIGSFRNTYTKIEKLPCLADQHASMAVY